jgi:hypothetical protein
MRNMTLGFGRARLVFAVFPLFFAVAPRFTVFLTARFVAIATPLTVPSLKIGRTNSMDCLIRPHRPDREYGLFLQTVQQPSA